MTPEATAGTSVSVSRRTALAGAVGVAFGLVGSGGTTAETIRLAVASDGHYADPYGRSFESNHERMMAALNRESAEYVIFNGDNICHPADGRQDALTHLRDEYYESLEAPYATVAGNHDLATDDDWEAVWDAPKDRVVEIGPVGCIILDSFSADAGGQVAPDLTFLEDALERLAHAEFVLVFSHYWFNEELEGVLDGPGTAEVYSEEALDLIHGTENVLGLVHGHNHGETAEGVYHLSHAGVERPYLMSGIFGGVDGGCRLGYRTLTIDSPSRAPDRIETRYKALETGFVLRRDRLATWSACQ